MNSDERVLAGVDGDRVSDSSQTRITSSDQRSEEEPQIEDTTLQFTGGLIVFALFGTIGGLIWWLGWSGSLYLALWIFTAAMTFAAVYAAWSAFVSSRHQTHRTVLLITAAGLAIVSFAGFNALSSKSMPKGSPEIPGTPHEQAGTAIVETPSKEATATLAYWKTVRGALASVESISPCAESQTVPELLSCLESASDTCSLAAESIKGASTRHVDAEVNELGARYISLFQNSSSYFDRIQSVLVKRQNLEEYAGSPAALVESTLRGFLGDPFGKYNEIQQANRHLGAEFNNAQRELQHLSKLATDLSAESHRLRGAMSSKYELDFPALE